MAATNVLRIIARQAFKDCKIKYDPRSGACVVTPTAQTIHAFTFLDSNNKDLERKISFDPPIITSASTDDQPVPFPLPSTTQPLVSLVVSCDNQQPDTVIVNYAQTPQPYIFAEITSRTIAIFIMGAWSIAA